MVLAEQQDLKYWVYETVESTEKNHYVYTLYNKLKIERRWRRFKGFSQIFSLGEATLSA